MPVLTLAIAGPGQELLLMNFSFRASQSDESREHDL